MYFEAGTLLHCTKSCCGVVLGQSTCRRNAATRTVVQRAASPTTGNRVGNFQAGAGEGAAGGLDLHAPWVLGCSTVRILRMSRLVPAQLGWSTG